MIYRHTLDMLVATWPTNCHLRTTQQRRLVPGRRYAFDAMRPMPSLDRTCPGRPPTLLGSTTPYVIALHRHVTIPLRTNHLRIGLASSWPIYSRCHNHHPTPSGGRRRHRHRTSTPASMSSVQPRRAAALQTPPAVPAGPPAAPYALPSCGSRRTASSSSTVGVFNGSDSGATKWTLVDITITWRAACDALRDRRSVRQVG